MKIKARSSLEVHVHFTLRKPNLTQMNLMLRMEIWKLRELAEEPSPFIKSVVLGNSQRREAL